MKTRRTKANGRHPGGAIIAIVVVLGTITALIGIGLYQLALSMSSTNQVTNAVDAGGLNVANSVVSITTEAKDADEREFDDVADSHGNFNLTNINRVWSKALLAHLNVNGMNATGSASGVAMQHADALFQAASRINNRLSAQLKDGKTLPGMFEAVSESNRANLLGGTQRVSATNANRWRASYVDRNIESNIEFLQHQLPDAANDIVRGATAADGKVYFAGYNPMKVLGKTFYMVPFKHNERPQLIARSEFEKCTLNSQPLSASANTLPNAYQVEGAAKGADGTHASVAFVKANPQRKFDLGMPHAFVRIKIKANNVYFAHNGIPQSMGSYRAANPEAQMQTFSAGSGTANVTAWLGMEYLPPTVFQAIYALPGNHNRVTEALLQRCREIEKDFTKEQLFAALQTPLVPGVDDYLLVPTAKHTIIAVPAPGARLVADWIDVNADADGSKKQIATEYAALMPNFATVVLSGAGIVAIPPVAFTTETGEESWKPGSGYHGCLGELQVERTTYVASFGLLIPPP